MKPKINNSGYDQLYAGLAKCASAINYYLSYIELSSVPALENKSGARPHFITESAVRFPLSEYLERRMGVSDLELEYVYEKFHGKRCDFRFTVPIANQKNECLCEIKYVKNKKVDLQDYCNDILRLHFANSDENKRTFLLVCGESSNFINSFVNRSVVESGAKVGNEFYTRPTKFASEPDSDLIQIYSNTIGDIWLSTGEKPEKKMTVRPDLWDDFRASHFFKSGKREGENCCIPFRDDPMPVVIDTKRVCLFIKQRGEGLPHAIGIWEIF